MTLSEWVALFGFPLVMIVTLITVVIRIRETVKLQSILDESIILVPLHKSSKPMIFASLVVSTLALGSLAGLIINLGALVESVAYASIFIICLSFIGLIACMRRFRMAVTESGVLVPYRFMKWEYIYDYALGEGEIFFTSTKNGQPSVAYTTPRLKFSESDQDKLKHLLDVNSNINK